MRFLFGYVVGSTSSSLTFARITEVQAPFLGILWWCFGCARHAPRSSSPFLKILARSILSFSGVPRRCQCSIGRADSSKSPSKASACRVPRTIVLSTVPFPRVRPGTVPIAITWWAWPYSDPSHWPVAWGPISPSWSSLAISWVKMATVSHPWCSGLRARFYRWALGLCPPRIAWPSSVHQSSHRHHLIPFAWSSSKASEHSSSTIEGTAQPLVFLTVPSESDPLSPVLATGSWSRLQAPCLLPPTASCICSCWDQVGWYWERSNRAHI